MEMQVKVENVSDSDDDIIQFNEAVVKEEFCLEVDGGTAPTSQDQRQQETSLIPAGSRKRQWPISVQAGGSSSVPKPMQLGTPAGFNCGDIPVTRSPTNSVPSPHATISTSKNARVSHGQWEQILQEIEKNPSIFTGYKNSARGRETNARVWRSLASRLNSSGSGTTKAPQEWATWFNNSKCKLKKKVWNMRIDVTGTGGEAAMASDLTDLELRLLALLGPGFGQGPPRPRLDPLELVQTEDVAEVTHDESSNSYNNESVVYNETLSPPTSHLAPHNLPSPPSPAMPSPPPELPSPAPAPNTQPEAGTLPAWRPRRRRPSTRRLSPLDEANRRLIDIKNKRIDVERRKASALELIGAHLGHLVTLLQNNHRT